MRRAPLPWLLLCATLGCASGPRFLDQPTVWRVEDDADIPEPAENEFGIISYGAEIFLTRALPRALELRDREPAHNTNNLDEVPDSTWFTNRIGVRDVTPAEAARGAACDGPPQLPITIVAGKSGGGNPGFIVSDATGRRFLIKFDPKDNPEMQTATGVIVNRMMWTLGYNVPADTVFYFYRDQLLIGDGAQYKNELGRKLPVTTEWVEEVLAHSPVCEDAIYRASASRFLEGVPKGGLVPEGVRPDDPNDVIPHEHRRELRGLRVFAAWLGHTDMKEDNTLDMYVEEDGRHFLRHYLLDFGEALGAHQAEKSRYEDGWEYFIDWELNGLAALAFGLWKRPWEEQQETPWPAIGAFSAEHFEPRLWREAYPYWPFGEADAADLYWGAKLVLRFDRPLIEAVVAEGWISNPDAEAFLVEALLQRREKIGQEWLEAVTPLDYFTIRDGEICAVDVGIQSGVATDGVVERVGPRYRPEFDDDDLEHLRDVEEFRVAPDGTVCLPLSNPGDYTIDRLRIRRGEDFKPVMQVHYRGGDQPRVLGVIRVEKR